MRLTPREKVMLIVLAGIALIALSYYFIIRPEITKISGLKASNIEMGAKVQEVETELASGSNLDAQIQELTGAVTQRTQRFYPESLQDQLILTLDQLLSQNQLTTDSYTFGQLTVKEPTQAAAQATDAAAQAGTTGASAFPLKDLTSQYNNLPTVSSQIAAQDPTQGSVTPVQPSPEAAVPAAAGQQTSSPVEFMNVSLQISGTYDGVMNFIRSIEGLNKTILVNSLSVNKDNTGMATASISMDFYAIPKLFGTDVQ